MPGPYPGGYDSLIVPSDGVTNLDAAWGDPITYAVANLQTFVGLSGDAPSSTGTQAAKIAYLLTAPGGIFKQTPAPTSPSANDLWIDTSAATRPLAIRVGTAWPLVGANALQLQGVTVDTTAPTDGQVLTYHSTGTKWAPAAAAGGMVDPFTTAGELLYRGASAPAALAIGSAGQMLGVSGGFPAWVTPGFIADPNGAPVGAVLVKNASSVWSYLAPSATTGDVLTGQGTGAVPIWTAVPAQVPGSDILAPSGPRIGAMLQWTGSIWDKLLPGAAGQVLTAHGDNNVVGSLLTWATPSSGLTNPMSTLADLIMGNTGGAPMRLGIGTTGQVLTVVSGAPAWATDTHLVNPMTTLGDLITGGSAGAAGRLGIGTTNQVLTVISGVPAWANSASGFADPETTIGDMIFRNGSNVTARLPIGSAAQVLTVVSGVPAWAAATGGGGSGGSRLALTTSGLIADYDFSNKADATLSNAADADGWQVATTIDAGTWIFRNGRLVNTGHGNYDRLRNMNVSQLAGVYEVHGATPSQAGHYIGHRFLVQSAADTDFHTLQRTADRQLNSRAAGSNTSISTGTNFTAINNELFNIKTKFTFPGSVRTLSHWLNGVLMFAGTSSSGPTTAGGIGLVCYPNGSGLDTEFTRYSVYSDTVVTVTGLSGTQAWRLFNAGGGVIGSSGTQSGGTTTVDTALTALMPLLGHIVVYTDNTYATPATGNSRFPVEGEATIWGGSSYLFT